MNTICDIEQLNKRKIEHKVIQNQLKFSRSDTLINELRVTTYKLISLRVAFIARVTSYKLFLLHELRVTFCI